MNRVIFGGEGSYLFWGSVYVCSIVVGWFYCLFKVLYFYVVVKFFWGK